MALNLGKIPVFVFPNSLKFYLTSRQSHRQLLTLYNPYNFTVQFQVFSNAPNKYTVIDPEGTIGSQACVDIVIRHNMPTAANCNVVDRFRISMQDYTTKQLMGKREVDAVLYEDERDNVSNDGDNFHSLPRAEPTVDERVFQHSNTNRFQTLPRSASMNYFLIFSITLALIILCLPSRPEAPQELAFNIPVPNYLFVTVQIKLVASFFLGIITTILIRSWQ